MKSRQRTMIVHSKAGAHDGLDMRSATLHSMAVFLAGGRVEFWRCADSLLLFLTSTVKPKRTGRDLSLRNDAFLD